MKSVSILSIAAAVGTSIACGGSGPGPATIGPRSEFVNQTFEWRDTFETRDQGDYDQLEVVLNAGVPYTIETADADGDTVLYLLNANREVILSDDDGGEGTLSTIRYSVPVRGRYLIRLRAFSKGFLGHCTLRISEATPWTLVPGQSLNNQRFEWSDAFSARQDGDYARYQLSLTAGQRVAFFTPSTSGGEDDSYLYLLDSGLHVVAEDNDRGGAKKALLAYTPTTTGTYYLLLRAATKGKGGSCTLLMRSLASKAISLGTPMAGEIFEWADDYANREDGDYAQYEVALTSGERYSFITRDLSGSEPSSYLYLLDPTDQIVARDESFRGSNGRSIITYTAASTSTHRLRVRSVTKGKTGSCTILVQSMASQVFTLDTTLSNAIFEWSATETNRQDGTYAQYEVELLENKQYLFKTTNAAGGEGNPALYLLNSDLQTIAENDDFGPTSLFAFLTFSPATSGTYTLRLRAHTQGSVGTCSLSGLSLSPLPLVPGDQLPLQFFSWHSSQVNRQDGGYGEYTVELVQGVTYTFDTADSVGGENNTVLYLLDHNDQVVAQDDDTGDLLHAKLVYTATAAGPYRLRVRAFTSGQSGTCTIRLTSDAVRTLAPGVLYDNEHFSTRNHFYLKREDGRYGEYELSLTAGVSYSFETSRATNPTGSEDTYLYLVDENLAFVAADDDGGANAYSLLTVTPTTTGRYYLRLRAYSFGSQGSCRLAMRQN